MNKPKNLLVQYQGGEYDGCVWEWNFFCFDSKGKFYNIFSSGSAGVETEEQALNLLDENKPYSGIKSPIVTHHCYKLKTKKALLELAKKTNVYLLKGLIEWFGKHLQEYNVYALCSKCGHEIQSIEDLIIEGEDEIICGECYSANSCGYCGDYCNSENLICSEKDIVKNADSLKSISSKTLLDILDNYAPLCVHCFERLVEREYE
jgi:hypothetical protein